MIYEDRIYGSADITEPVLVDLIASAALQRLQGVLQHGVSALIGITRETSRFEHSMGVMLLVRRLGASLEEQIAALLHDVSHTAFSHVIDYVFNGHETQGFHEEHKLEYVSGTDIPSILGKYGYHWTDFMDEGNFTLLERALPHLCADRLDYFLRDSYDLSLATDREISDTLAHLSVHHGQMVVDEIGIARWLGYAFIEADKTSWANFREVGLYELAARAIRRGLEIGVLNENDLWSIDRLLWEKLQASDDLELQYNLRRVHPDTLFFWDDNNPSFWVATKLRSIDPDVFLSGQGFPLSALDPDFALYRQAYLAKNQGKWPMRVLSKDGEGIE